MNKKTKKLWGTSRGLIQTTTASSYALIRLMTQCNPLSVYVSQTEKRIDVTMRFDTARDLKMD